MKYPLALVALALVSQFAIAGFMDSYDVRVGPIPYPEDYSGGGWLPNVDGSGFRGGNRRSLEDPQQGRTRGRVWVPASPARPVDGQFGQMPFDTYGSREGSAGGLYERLRSPGYREPDPWSAPRDGYGPSDRRWGPGGGQGYHFRGDDLAGGETWRAERQDGEYRFRPLTEQERERVRPHGVWRVASPTRNRARTDPIHRLDRIPIEEAYGYQPDNWFQRYYGDRP